MGCAGQVQKKSVYSEKTSPLHVHHSAFSSPTFVTASNSVVAFSHRRAAGDNLAVETEYLSNLEHAHWAYGRCLLGAQPKVLCLRCIASLQWAFPFG